ncbi:PAS domain S-box protein [Edaphobacter sp. HDX4]|uniref:PAS domain S-box protein n=1 Tax=Edaphobacter sp. HDX4 TaxID=2794064 RepID=UPI002FE54BDA
MSALLVKDEAPRSQGLEQKNRPNPQDDRALDELALLAKQICDVSVAMVWDLDAGSVHVKAAAGIAETRLAPETLPWDAAMERDAVFEISDARLEPEFAPDGFTIEGQSFCFYAATPLTTASGASFGVLAVLDQASRQLTEAQARGLRTLARQMVAKLEWKERLQQLDELSRAQEVELVSLTQQNRLLSAVLETVDTLVAVFDSEGRIVRFNKACEDATGYKSTSLAGGYIWDQLVPQDEVAAAKDWFEKLRDGSFPAAFENRWVHRDGSKRRIGWSATELRDIDGQVMFIVATGSDLTTKEPEDKYRQLVEGSLGIVFTHDLDGRLLSLNTHGAATVGRRVEEMVGSPLASFVPLKRRSTIEEYLDSVVKTGKAQGMLHLEHINGDVRVVAYRNKLIADGDKSPYVLGFGVDITEQVKAERKLRTLTRQSNSILESVGDGIFCIDREGRATVVNAAAAQMLGYKQEEMLGRVMHSLIQHTRGDSSPYPMSESPICKSLTSFGTTRVRDELFWRKDGTSFPVEYVARPLIDANASDSGSLRALGVVVAFTDTSERRALDQMKDEFISTVSHELRTPLTSLRGALGLLSGGALLRRPEKSQQMLDIAINNADRLVRLVNDIVDLERISSGKNELHLTMVRARELLHGTVNVCEAQNPGSSQRIRLRPTEVSVWADSERILQVLNNLLSNAFKFSSSDAEVYISVRPVDDQEALFEVRDHGRGIAPDKLERIFDRFQQEDASDSRALGGTGLGLTICHRIIDLHGGRIWATSTAGLGTSVYFTLPTRPRMNLR